MNETVAYINDSLKGLYSRDEIRNFIRLIMEHVCDLKPYRLLAGKGRELSATEKRAVHDAVERLKQWEPVQYVLGETLFYGLPFRVDGRALIPRPETEELVDLIVKDCSGRKAKILDVGAGSGCIAVALARSLPYSELTAVDLSEDALCLAKENAAMNNVQVSFVVTDILSPVRSQREIPGTFDVIVSNPPYVMEHEKADMEKNVLLYEPPRALFVADDDPLAFYRAIARLSTVKLDAGGALYFEINSQLGKETAAALSCEGYGNIEIMTDLRGKDRIIKASR
ncbi:MAG: peptide chain release factor N(5)-glutamine methyltransferase [Tannerellaceae bacterium]|jgi:release factor glutamine methyltransferase|nr:peptide chain release factor N(5)-glutamine methyltransferase [Tannerellaceae bacterium]